MSGKIKTPEDGQKHIGEFRDTVLKKLTEIPDNPAAINIILNDMQNEVTEKAEKLIQENLQYEKAVLPNKSELRKQILGDEGSSLVFERAFSRGVAFELADKYSQTLIDEFSEISQKIKGQVAAAIESGYVKSVYEGRILLESYRELVLNTLKRIAEEPDRES